MSFIKTYKKEILLSLLITIIYFFTRLFRIMTLPIFTDESIYIRWGQIALHDPSWRFISLTDGKQPMFVWVEMFALKLIKDPLLAGRLVGVGSGFLTTIGMFFLGREIFKNKWVGFLSALIYVLFPFALVYDRMALYEPMVNVFTIWSLYIEVLLIRRVRLDIALILGMVFGGGALTKSDVYFSMILLPFSVILFDFSQKNARKKLFKWIGFAILAVSLGYLYYNILRLSPFFGIIGEKNDTFIYSFHTWIKTPFAFVLGNLGGLWNWFTVYVNLPLLLTLIIGLLVSLKYFRERLLLLGWFAGPFIALAFFGKVMYPRYILFMVLPLIPIMAFGIYRVYKILKNMLLGVLIFLLAMSMSFYANYFIIFNFAHAPIPRSDLNQYINDWPAGGGVNQMLSYFKSVSNKNKIYVGTEGTFGSVPTLAMQIYLENDHNIITDGYYPIPATLPLKVAKFSKIMPTYFVFEQTQIPPSAWPLKLIVRYRKGIGNSYMSIYKVVDK